MADVTKAALHAARLTASMVPDTVRAQISQEELADRVVHAEQLAVKARDATDRELAAGYTDLARAVLKAAPRDEVDRQYRQLIEQADNMHPGAARDRVLAAAEKLLRDHPPAPSRQDYPARPETQAKNTRPPLAGGGTTGLGKPRTGGPQRGLPGDFPGRAIVKAQAPGDSEDTGPQWPSEALIIVHDAAGNVVGAVPQSKLIAVIDAADAVAGLAGQGRPAPKAQRRDSSPPRR